MTEAVLEEKKFVKCRVRITMTPIEFTDEYFKVPDQEKILEHLLECLENRELDAHFDITVTVEE